eukprot:jgi/Galph1/650/GphlegSOOS_G5390.1
MGCLQSKVPVEQISESELVLSSVEAIQEPSRVARSSAVNKHSPRHEQNETVQKTSLDTDAYQVEELYRRAKLKVDAWYARMDNSVIIGEV